MKKCAFILLFGMLVSPVLRAQYRFVHEHLLPHTAIESQDRTGTCWSYSTASFVEAEVMRKGHKPIDLSEMFVARNVYKDKARNYMLRQGKANFSQGGLAHDLLREAANSGVIPEAVYAGLPPGQKKHDHTELEHALKGMLDGVLKGKKLTKYWPVAFEGILDAYLGPPPHSFIWEGQTTTPEQLAARLDIHPEEYVTITSFTHHPWYTSFVLEIPDNYSNGSYLNVPLNEMVDILDGALEKGFSVVWDGDVSEPGFKAKKGLAILPADIKRTDLWSTPGPEKAVDQPLRQRRFESLHTTDDHLMHIIGTAEDETGKRYYVIKNSWGEVGPYKGLLYMSLPYLQLKTVAITVHKDALSDEMKRKLGMK